MFSNYNHFAQKGYGNFEDDDDDIESSRESEQSSQSSQSSEEMDSSGQEEEEHVDPWSRIQNKVCNRHEAQLEALINEYEQNGCLLYTSPSPRDGLLSRMPSSA